MIKLAEMLKRWDSNEGKPYKGMLIDFDAFEADPQNIGCMCAQGQVLHLLGGWAPEKLRSIEQEEADQETAKLLNISVAHSILLRSINDKRDGAPSIVLTHPEKILGDQAQTVLAFWLYLDTMSSAAWVVAGDAAWVAARGATWGAARDAARDVAWVAARDAARVAARVAAWVAARDAARVAAYACSEIQGARVMREKNQAFFFLPLFGFAEPEAIPALPAGYGEQHD